MLPGTLARAYGKQDQYCHKFVGLVPTVVRCLHQLLQLVQVKVSLQAGDDIVELILLNYQTRLDWNIRLFVIK